MSKFNATATLISSTVSYDEDGNSHEVFTEHDVCANKLTIGLSAWAAARSGGLHADSSIQMRSCEYHGEQMVRLDGIEYEVERVQSPGEFATLTLKRRLRNG